jgi:hypothetical protein
MRSNPNARFATRIYSKLEAMRFISFSFMEFGVAPPEEPAELMTGLFYFETPTREDALVAIMEGDKICSFTIINKKTFELIMTSLKSTE